MKPWGCGQWGEVRSLVVWLEGPCGESGVMCSVKGVVWAAWFGVSVVPTNNMITHTYVWFSSAFTKCYASATVVLPGNPKTAQIPAKTQQICISTHWNTSGQTGVDLTETPTQHTSYSLWSFVQRPANNKDINQPITIINMSDL